MYRILSAFIFFTRLPFWRIANVPKEYYERVVPLWPMVGWLTGGMMGLISWFTFGLPVHVSVVLCLIIRVLITGALHEDGFADFCDGFGGGTDRQRVLDIMKDSHIGTYGVLGLILYFLLLVSSISRAVEVLDSPFEVLALMMIADTFCKWCASTIVYFLPYARKETEAKNKLVYASVSVGEKILSIALGILPAGLFLYFSEILDVVSIAVPAVASMATAAFLFRYMHRRIQGYTGDCCGASFIICETVFYLVFVAML